MKQTANVYGLSFVDIQFFSGTDIVTNNNCSSQNSCKVGHMLQSIFSAVSVVI